MVATTTIRRFLRASCGGLAMLGAGALVAQAEDAAVVPVVLATPLVTDGSDSVAVRPTQARKARRDAGRPESVAVGAAMTADASDGYAPSRAAHEARHARREGLMHQQVDPLVDLAGPGAGAQGRRAVRDGREPS